MALSNLFGSSFFWFWFVMGRAGLRDGPRRPREGPRIALGDLPGASGAPGARATYFKTHIFCGALLSGPEKGSVPGLVLPEDCPARSHPSFAPGGARGGTGLSFSFGKSGCTADAINALAYSGGPHTRFHEFWEGSLRILGSGVPLRRNPPSGALNSTLPGPREGSSILNVHLVVVTAAVPCGPAPLI
jgi:hypothetical protein